MKTDIKNRIAVAAFFAVGNFALMQPGITNAADHGDAPLMAQDSGADIADIYFFMDPSDDRRVVLVQTQRGFIVPGESENLALFDPQINYRLAVEHDGPPDASPDINFNVRFSPRMNSLEPQVATLRIRGINDRAIVFRAPTTVSSATDEEAPEPTITTDPRTGIKFFAGMVDDPFFFDVPAELLYRDSRFANQIDPTVFRRGRDTFAGYNVLAIALSVPVALLVGDKGPILGFSGYTERAALTVRSRANGPVDRGRFVVIDRMGIPAVNTVLIPYARKDAYNRSSASLDPRGRFQDDIVETLRALQTESGQHPGPRGLSGEQWRLSAFGYVA